MTATIFKKGTRPELSRCTKCCNLYHCAFCESYKSNSKVLIENHVENHIKVAHQHDDLMIVKCNLKCREFAHFHCCYCPATLIRKSQLAVHIKKCKETGGLVKGFQAQVPISMATAQPQLVFIRANSAPLLNLMTPPISTQSPTTLNTSFIPIIATPSNILSPVVLSKPPDATQDSSSAPILKKEPKNVCHAKKNRIQCYHCELGLNRKNLRLHLRRSHSFIRETITPKHCLRSQCIDSRNGIFAVERSFAAGSIPIHVQKKTEGMTDQVMCDEEQCNANNDFAEKNGLKTLECCHVESLAFYPEDAPQPVVLREELLAEMMRERFLGKSIKDCILRQWMAEKEDIPLSVEVMVSGASSKKYVSVYEPKTTYYCKLGRVIVLYNGEKNTWCCPCNRAKQSCIHKAVARWHLFQTQRGVFKKQKSDGRVDTPQPQNQPMSLEYDPMGLE